MIQGSQEPINPPSIDESLLLLADSSLANLGESIRSAEPNQISAIKLKTANLMVVLAFDALGEWNGNNHLPPENSENDRNERWAKLARARIPQATARFPNIPEGMDGLLEFSDSYSGYQREAFAEMVDARVWIDGSSVSLAEASGPDYALAVARGEITINPSMIKTDRENVVTAIQAGVFEPVLRVLTADYGLAAEPSPDDRPSGQE